MHKPGLLPWDSRIRQRIQQHLHCHENHTGYKCNTRTNTEDVNQNNSEEDQRDTEFDGSSDEDVEDHGWKELLIQGEIGSSAMFLLAAKTRFGRVVRFNNRLLY